MHKNQDTHPAGAFQHPNICCGPRYQLTAEISASPKARAHARSAAKLKDKAGNAGHMRISRNESVSMYKPVTVNRGAAPGGVDVLQQSTPKTALC